MTICEFAEKNRVRQKTVKEWISKGYIPGANESENYIPDSARKPYTQARARNAKAIYSSIIKASYNLCHVVPQLYGICKEEFDGYIQCLRECGLIAPRVADGITYYDATMKAIEYIENNVENTVVKIIEVCFKGTAQGVTEVLVAKASGEI